MRIWRNGGKRNYGLSYQRVQTDILQLIILKVRTFGVAIDVSFSLVKRRFEDCRLFCSETKKKNSLSHELQNLPTINVYLQGFRLHKFLPELCHGDGTLRGWFVYMFDFVYVLCVSCIQLLFGWKFQFFYDPLLQPCPLYFVQFLFLWIVVVLCMKLVSTIWRRFLWTMGEISTDGD